MRSRYAILAFCAISLSLPIPASAGAASAEFTARASNGYRIEVSDSRRRVRLLARGPAGTATYTVPGRVTQRGIQANFGKRGIVDVSFRPSGRAIIETPPRRCEGKPRVARWGSFVGTIRFKGERGYTRLHVRRAGGRTRSAPRWRCKRPGRARASGSEAERAIPVVLELSDRRRGLEVGILSFGEPGKDSLTFYAASMQERRGRMRIARSYFEITTSGTPFAYDESLSEATIAPPPPFAGKGLFERRKGRDSWTGSLSVVLPGTPRISLVGKRFRPRLYRLDEDGIAKPGA